MADAEWLDPNATAFFNVATRQHSIAALCARLFARLTRPLAVLVQPQGLSGMTGFAFKRRIGCGAAFIAAYALVFNVILSSILVSGISPLAAAAAHELCVSSQNADAARTDADKHSGKTTAHCPLCVGHVVAGGLPPPTASLAERIALRPDAVFSFRDRIFARARSFAHLTRGPPRLI